MSNDHFHVTIYLRFCKLGILTAVLFIRGAVVIAVIDAVAYKVLSNAAAIAAGELCVWVARSE